MAFEGELVKMENGRWARFQHLTVADSSSRSWGSAILVAVELEERFQTMLNVAAGSLEGYYERGVAMKLRLDPNAQGEMSVRLEEATIH